MIKQMRISVIILVSCCSGLIAEPPSLIPRPLSMQSREGSFRITATTTVFAAGGAEGEAKKLIDALAPAIDLKMSNARPSGDALILTLDDALRAELGAEGYNLDVTPTRIDIRAAEAAGLFYGIQTLRQLLPPEIYSSKKVEDVTWSIPCVEITDQPRFAWRAFLLDSARHFRKVDTVKSLIEQIARLKMNVFHWHLTDDQGWRIEIKKYPKLVEVGAKRNGHEGYYSQEQIKEIVQYAADRHITIVPEIEMPGHASAAIAAYPELGTRHEQIQVPTRWGKLPGCFNPADENVYRILGEILDEVIALFPGEVLHIGGDEVRFDHWKQSDEVKELMQREGLKTLADVQLYFTNRMSWLIMKKGRRMMGWNDIMGDDLHGFLKGGQTAKSRTLSPSTIVQFWKGDQVLAEKALKSGHDVVNSWHSFTYLDYPYDKVWWSISLKKAYEFDPIFKGLDPKYHSRIKGLGCQMWGERIPTVAKMEYQVYPRVAAYAEVGWTQPEQKNFQDFSRRMTLQCRRWDLDGIRYYADYKEIVPYEGYAISLTTGKPVTCSSAEPGNPAKLANDGERNNTNSFWATDVAKCKVAWWQVDLEKPTTVGRVVVVGYYGNTRHYGFTVETSLDGKKWDMVADKRENKELSTVKGITCKFDQRKVRYIKVTQTHNSANTGRHLVEVMAFDK